MKVKELIERLQQMPQDLDIMVTTEDSCGYSDVSAIELRDYRATYPTHEPFVIIEGD